MFLERHDNLSAEEDNAPQGLPQASITGIVKRLLERRRSYRQAHLYEELASLHGDAKRPARGKALLGAGVYYAHAGFMKKSIDVKVKPNI
jgi:hypothetical protein